MIKIEADLTAGTTTTWWNKWHFVFDGGVSLFPVHCRDTAPLLPTMASSKLEATLMFLLFKFYKNGLTPTQKLLLK